MADAIVRLRNSLAFYRAWLSDVACALLGPDGKTSRVVIEDLDIYGAGPLSRVP